MIGYSYWDGGSIPTLQQDLIKAGLSIGMIGGMLTFGIFGDALGRHKVYGKELAFTLLGTLMIVLTPWKNFSRQSVIAWTTFWRVFTGFGIGGGTLHASYFPSSALSTDYLWTDKHQ